MKVSSPEASRVEVVSGTPSHAWISPEKQAQKFQIDLSKSEQCLCIYCMKHSLKCACSVTVPRSIEARTKLLV